MSNAATTKRRAPIRFLFEYSGFLIAGTVIALIWANADPDVDALLHELAEIRAFYKLLMMGAS